MQLVGLCFEILFIFCYQLISELCLHIFCELYWERLGLFSEALTDFSHGKHTREKNKLNVIEKLELRFRAISLTSVWTQTIYKHVCSSQRLGLDPDPSSGPRDTTQPIKVGDY